MQSTLFGKLPDCEARLYTLENSNGMKLVFSDLGCIITNIILGDGADVVLGHADISGYVGDSMYCGALIGRNSNRIANAMLRLDGQEYQLERNNGNHNLHGGSKGLSNRVFCVEELGASSVRLDTTIPHMEDGFPGKLDVSVTYTLSADNAVIIDYCAVSDRTTVINLTNHSYFNLCGHSGPGVGGHVLTIGAPFYAPNTPECIPTGEVLAVAGTPFDFRGGATIGDVLQSGHEQIELLGGLDHSFMLEGRGMRKVASQLEPESGREMEVYTTLPVMQIYTANFLPDGQQGKGMQYAPHQGICFETQLVPNAINMPWLRQPVYSAGQEYRESTCFKFSW